MSEINKYEAGTPNWIDLGSPDPDASARFYSGVFGWEVSDANPDPEGGGYRMATLGGRPVAGIGPAQDQGSTPWWATYISVEDADATAKLVGEAGGQVLVPPFDVQTFGRMAVFADPAGAPFSVWQPIEHPGAMLVNEHGTLTWNELHTRDIDGAKAFYGKVLGWKFADVDMNMGFVYTLFKLTDDESDQGIGGFMPIGGDQPAELPAHWKVYFGSDDTDATAAKVTELGGTVLMEPTTMPGVGRMAAFNGPTGEEFWVIKGEPQQDS